MKLKRLGELQQFKHKMWSLDIIDLKNRCEPADQMFFILDSLILLFLLFSFLKQISFPDVHRCFFCFF